MTETEVDNNPRTSAESDWHHEHAWRVESGHPTTLGRVLYVHCVWCGAQRVDLQVHPQVPPSALSEVVCTDPVRLQRR